MTPEIRAARMAALSQWVTGWYVPTFRYRFPPEGTALARGTPPPFPACWGDHRELVLALDLAKCRHDQLVDGDARDYRAEDWIAFNDEHLLPLIWYIGRLCRTDHRDLTMVRATPEVVIQQPPLPGTAPVRAEARPALPGGWRDALTKATTDTDGVGT